MTAWRSLTLWIGVGILAVVGVAVALAGQWDIEGRLFPWAVGIPLIFVATLTIIIQLVRSGLASTWSKDHQDRLNPRVLKERIGLLIWVAGLLSLMALVGHLVGAPLFLFVFMIKYGERLWIAALAAFVMWAFMFFVLGALMHVHFPTPYLIQWFAP